MFRRILLITLTLSASVLHGMWCFDQPFRDAYDTYGLFIRGVQKNKDFEAKLKSTPLYRQIASWTPGFRECSLHGRTAISLLFCNKKHILKNLQEQILKNLLNVFDTKDPDYRPSFKSDFAFLASKTIAVQVKYSEYQSFIHGADGNLTLFLTLQKKLYEKFHSAKLHDFEFLRTCGGRKDLVGITCEKYIERNHDIEHSDGTKIYDLEDPWRTELLSVTDSTGDAAFAFCLRNSSYKGLDLKKWIYDAFARYDLPMPSCIDCKFPEIKHGVLLQVSLKKNVTDRLVYPSADYGVPRVHAEKDQPYDQIFGYRIILDPTVFDDPSDEVKIIRHQQLSDEEKKEIDTFCDNLIAQAEKLKAEQEKS